MGTATKMRTVKECLAQAASMDRQAEQSDCVATGEDMRFMAKCWRELAILARWQDGPLAP
jgi:hypothetical protein